MLLAVYEFGSFARGDADELSDYDVLGVVSGDRLTDLDGSIRFDLRERAAISWYSSNRLIKMYSDGDLFAWHLHQEARPLLEQGFKLGDLGSPNRYTQAVADIISFIVIIEDSFYQILINPQNSGYEFGVFYVCARNIAMSASSILCGRPDFSRYSPYNFCEALNLPIDRHSFELAMNCRMAGHRGIGLAQWIEPSMVLDACTASLIWARRVLEVVREKQDDTSS